MIGSEQAVREGKTKMHTTRGEKPIPPDTIICTSHVLKDVLEPNHTQETMEQCPLHRHQHKTSRDRFEQKPA